MGVDGKRSLEEIEKDYKITEQQFREGGITKEVLEAYEI
jgi:hypothetical protein